MISSTHNHALAPCHWFSHCDELQDAKGNMLVEASLYFLLPVEWHRERCVVGHWLCVWVPHEAHWDAIHEGERLMFTCVECAGPVILVGAHSLCCWEWGCR